MLFEAVAGVQVIGYAFHLIGFGILLEDDAVTWAFASSGENWGW
jgi:TM2 domain-containing membrane protein YozV